LATGAKCELAWLKTPVGRTRLADDHVSTERNAVTVDFHDVTEVWGAGQQQVRNIWMKETSQKIAG
jgi:hypothetical protein